MGKVKRTLSILLAVAMVVTCVPQTGLSALAATETLGITEAAETEAAEVKVETPESNSEVTDDAEAEDAADEEDSTEVIGEGGKAETPADDEKAQEPVVDDEKGEESLEKTIFGEESEEQLPVVALEFAESQVKVTIDGTEVSDSNKDELHATVSGAAKDGAYEFTVTPKDNYRIPSGGVAVTYGNENTSVTPTVDGTTYTISADVIATIGTDDVTIAVTTEAISYSVTVTKQVPEGDEENAVFTAQKYSVATAPEVGTDANLENNAIHVNCEQTLTLKFTVATGYQLTVTRKEEGTAEGTTVAAGASSEGSNYVYKIANITKDTTLTVNAEKETVKEYNVTIENDNQDNATVTFDPELTGGKIKEGNDLVFTVTPDAGYELAADNAVQYKVGTSGTYTDAAKDGGNYKVASGSITDDITIKVTTVKIKYTISFDLTGATGATVAVGTENASATPAAVEAGIGDTITFVVTPGKTGDNDNKLRYVNTTNSAEGAMSPTSTAEGAYTFTYTVDKDTARATTIYVNATPAQDVNVNFTKTGSEPSVSVYEVKETEADGNKVLTVEPATTESIAAKEDSKVYFIAELPEGSVSAITSVKVGEKELSPAKTTVKRTVDDTLKDDEVDLYTLDLKDIDKNIAVAIVTELDETKANVATFSLAGEGEYIATVDGDDTKYTAGDKVLTAGDAITFTVEPAEDYFNIDKVEAVYEADKAGDSGKEETTVALTKESDSYTFEFKKDDTKVTREVTIKVTVSTKGTEKAMSFTVNNISNHMEYAVEVRDEEHPDRKVTKKAGTNHTYIVEEGATYVNMTVTAKGKFAPEVKCPNPNDQDDYRVFKGTKNDDVYTYAIPAVTLASDSATIVTIDEKPEQKWVAVLYDSSEAEVSAKVSGKELVEAGDDFTEDDWAEFESFESDYAVYKVPTDTEITVAVTALNNSSVASYTIGNINKKLNVASGKTGEFKVTAADNTTVQINSNSVYAITLKDADEESVAGSKNTYTVDYDAAYTAWLYKGESGIDVTDVTIEGTEAASTVAVEEANFKGRKRNVAKINVAAADAGKTLTVKLSVAGKVTAEDGTEKDGNVLAHTFKLSVKPKGTALAIREVKGGKLTQPVDTLTEYVITPTPATASLSNIEATVTAVADNADQTAINEAKDWVQAEITPEGKLAVTTKAVKDPADKKESAAKVVLKYKGADENLASFTVDVTKPALMDQTPGVKVTGSDDVKLNLELSTPNKVTTPNAGALWYKVVVTTDDTNAGDEIANTITKPFYFAKNKDAASQPVEVTVTSKSFGEGKACNFKVAVTLVQTIDETVLNSTGITDEQIEAATSCVSKTKENVAASTKDPYYTTKLSLKKGTTTVYTGQKVKIATPQFDKNTTYTSITATDTTGANGMVRVTYENGDIYMQVDHGYFDDYEGDSYYESTPLGKHTIEVTAIAPNNTYAAKATLTVNVVRGIEEISVSAPDTIYKADKKAATLKLAPTFNWGSTDKNRVPKAKKVSYEIVASDYVKASVSVKANGTVTVAKDYKVLADETENTFCVKVTAADFTGNTEYTYTNEITITAAGMEFGEVCIAEKNSVYDEEEYDDETQYTVVSRGDDFTSKQLNGNYLIVLKKGVSEKSVYSADEVIEVNNLTFKSGNKALAIDAFGRLSVSKTANNVKITVTANDGSKKSVVKTINIKYDEPAQLGLRVERQNDFDGKYYSIGADNSSAFTFKGTSDTVLKLTVVQRDGDNSEWEEVDQITNFKLAPSGAKVLNKNSQFNQSQLVIANKATVNVKLTIGSGKTKKDQTYTITNESFSSVKAPTVKGDGNVKTWLSNQTITYTVKDTDSATYSGKKMVLVKTDATDRAKKTNAYWSLEQAADGGLNGYHPIDKNGKFYLDFTTDYYDEDTGESYNYCDIQPGNYKLQFTFGDVDEDGQFIPETKTVAVTLKAEALKQTKGSYKPVSTVKMSLKDGGVVKLAGTGKNYYDESFGSLQNANIGGTANGFLKYFELSSYRDYYLKLKNTLTPTEINYITGDSKEAKNDRIGYVYYSVYIEGVGYKDGTAKITVNFDKNVDKTLLTYKASAPTIMEGTTDEFTINVTAGKANAELDYAYIKSDNFEAVNMACYNESIISVRAKAAPAVGNYATAVYVVPSGSYYAGEIDEAYWDWYRESNADAKTAKYKTLTDKFESRGILVNTTIKVTAKASTGGKIKIDKKDATQVFSQDKYNGTYKHYYVHVPYTKTMPCEITEIASKDTYLNGVDGMGERKNLFNFSADPGDELDPDDPDAKPTISVTIDKDKLEKAKDAGKVQLGKTYTVKATVKFGKWGLNSSTEAYEPTTDETIKTEEITLKLTLPNAISGNDYGYTAAVAAVKAAKAEITDKVSADLEFRKEWMTEGEYGEINYDAIYVNIIEPAYNKLEAEVKALAPEDSGTTVILTRQDEWEFAGEHEAFEAPTSTKDGHFNVVLRLTKTDEYNEDELKNGTYEDIAFELKIAKTMEEPNDLEDALETFKATMNSNETYTKAQDENTVRRAILEDARKAVKIGQYSTLRMEIVNDGEWVYDDESYEEVWEEYPFFTPATDQQPGSIKGQFHVWGIRYGGKQLYVPFDVELKRLDNISETKGLIEDALGALLDENGNATNLTTQKEVMDAASAAIVNKQFEVEWKQVEREVTGEDGKTETKVVDDWTLTPATRENGGSIEFTLILVNTKAAENDPGKQVDITKTWTIPMQAGKENAIAALKDALAIDTDGGVDDTDNDPFKSLVISNDSDTVQAAILAAAEKAVKKDGYAVAYQKDGEKVAFEFTKAKYQATDDDTGKGKVKYTLEVTDTQEKVAEGGTPAIEKVSCETEFGPYPELLSLEDAAKEVKAALEADEYVAALRNETDADSILGEARKAIITGANIDVDVKTDDDDEPVFTLTEATFKAAGKIEITLVLTKYVMVDDQKQTVGEPMDLTLELTIAKLTQKIAEAKTAALAALDDESLKFTNDDIEDDDAKTATMNKILDAVKAVVNTEQYDVIAQDNKITATKATPNQNGSIVITVVIAEKSPAEGQEAQKETLDPKTYDIVLDQSLDEAVEEAKKAIDAFGEAEGFKKENTTANEIKEAVEAVVKTSKFTVAWSEEDGETFNVAAASETGDGSITGVILISDKNDSTVNPVKVPVNIIWEYVAPETP